MRAANLHGIATRIRRQRARGKAGESGWGVWAESDIVGSRGPGGLYCSNAEERQAQMMVIGVGGGWKIKENERQDSQARQDEK
jgi:hypothetical protein